MDWPRAVQLADAAGGASPGDASHRTCGRPRAAAANWFRPAVELRSARTLERERWLCWQPCCGPFRRSAIVLPCIMTQACLGSIYSFSIFNSAMDSGVWGRPGTNAYAFLVSVAAYGACTAIFGAHVGRLGPFAACARALVFLPSAWAAAAAGSATGTLGLLVVYGLLLGFGISHGYLATTSCMQKWYPELKGAAAGVAVAGFGVGAFLWTLLGKMLLDPAGSYRWGVPAVQLLFSGIILVIIAATLPLLRLPPPGWVPPAEIARAAGGAAAAAEAAAAGMDDARALTAAPAAGVQAAAFVGPEAALEAPLPPPPPPPSPPGLSSATVASPRPSPTATSREPDEEYTLALAASQLEFWLLAVLVFGSSMPGVVFLSSSADMAQYAFGLAAGAAFAITAIQNLVNFLGRLFFGWLSDRVGRKTFYIIAALAQTIAVSSMIFSVRGGDLGWWLAAFLTIGALYGGTFGTLPALTLELFGPGISSATHGCMLSLWALSAVVGVPIFTHITATITMTTTGGAVHPAPEAYAINAEWLVLLPATATVAAALLNTRCRDRVLRKARRQLRLRLLAGRVLVVDRAVPVAAGGALPFGWRWRLLGPEEQEEEWREFMLERKEQGAT